MSHHHIPSVTCHSFPCHCVPTIMHPFCHYVPSVTTFPCHISCYHVPQSPCSTTVQCHCIPSVTMFPLLWCPFYHCVLCHISFVTVSSVTVSLLPPHPDMSCYHVPSHHIPSPYSFCHVPCHCSPLSLSLLSLSPSVTMFLLPPYHLSLHPSCVPSATTSLLSMYPSVTLEGLLGGVSASDLLGLPQEPPQPLNLTAKPKAPELPSTTSSPSLKMSSCGPRPPSHGAPTRDLQSSPPSLPLGKLLSRAWFFPSWGTRGPPLRVLA